MKCMWIWTCGMVGMIGMGLENEMEVKIRMQ